jgi:uncharacterized membrane protein
LNGSLTPKTPTPKSPIQYTDEQKHFDDQNQNVHLSFLHLLIIEHHLPVVSAVLAYLFPIPTHPNNSQYKFYLLFKLSTTIMDSSTQTSADDASKLNSDLFELVEKLRIQLDAKDKELTEHKQQNKVIFCNVIIILTYFTFIILLRNFAK